MKKTYQQPTTSVFILDTTDMVCASGISAVSGVDDLTLSDESTEEADITTGYARRRSLWDNEEEEEY